MNIEHMNLQGKGDLLTKIVSNLPWVLENLVDNEDEESLDTLLNALVPALDALDAYDGVGSEGWKENFGVS